MEKYSQRKRNIAPEWAKLLGITVKDFSRGFSNKQEYEGLHLTLEEFLLRISNCDIEKPEVLSRRNAAELKKKLRNKLE